MKILHIDASPRSGLGGLPPDGPAGSYSRRLSKHFIDVWRERMPDTEIRYRDIGAKFPKAVDEAWINAAFNPEGPNEAQKADLAESDELTQELLWADMLVLATPMYNFGLPSHVKAWIDNIVRVGLTLVPTGNPAQPIIPHFKNKRFPVVLLSSRGDFGMDAGGEYVHYNQLEPAVRTALGFIGIEEIHSVAIEYVTEGGEALDKSVERALENATSLVGKLQEGAKLASEEARIADTVSQFFAALGRDDFDQYRALTTDDMEAYDLGFHLTREQVVEFIKGAHAAGTSFVWQVTEPRVQVIGDQAWMTYKNVGSMNDGKSKQDKTWLESAVLQREGGTWRVRFLHSTEAAPPPGAA